MVILTAKEIAEIRNCSTQAVYKAPIPRTEGKEYDITDPKVREWVYAPYVAECIRNQKIAELSDLEDKASQELIDDKTRQQILNLKKQNRKLDFQHEVDKRGFVPSDIIRLWMGYFSSGIMNNVLQIGNRVARGDSKLRDKIEKEVKRAIEKTLHTAETQLRAEGENIKLTLGGESEE